MAGLDKKPDLKLDIYTKSLALSGKAFGNNTGLLQITLRKIDKFLNQSTFITMCPCPPGWEKCMDIEGYSYFCNKITNQITGVLPARRTQELTGRTVTAPTHRDFDMNGLRLPEGWTRECKTKDGRPHYFNATTKAAQRSTPLYQGEATSYTSSGVWDVKEAKPNVWDFQFFEAGFERNTRFDRWEIEIENRELRLPAGWEQSLTRTGKKYFVNHNERMTQWHHPLATPSQESLPYNDTEWDTDLEGLKLPEGWVRRCTKTGEGMYYVDLHTKKHYWP